MLKRMHYNVALLPIRVTNYITECLLCKVMRYNVALLPIRVTNYITECLFM